MVYGPGANPFFFLITKKKKIKIGRPEQLLTPLPPSSNNTSFLSYPTPPPQSGRHMRIIPFRNPL